MGINAARALTIVNAGDAQLAAQKAGSYIETLLKECLSCPILFMSSGGSSLNILEYIDPSLISDRVTITVADERWGEREASNFHNLANTNWFQESVKRMAHVIDSRVWDEHSLDLCAMHFGEVLHLWKDTHENGKIITLLGIREDGQIASISPMPDKEKEFNDKFIVTPAWATGYEAPVTYDYPKRITVTIPFLRYVNYGILYVCGENKKSILESTLSSDLELNILPARIIKDMPDVHLFTDIKL